MYKLIIGNVRVAVLDDGISRAEAVEAAKQAIAAAAQRGKSLSLVEIAGQPGMLELNQTERAGHKSVRKTLRQSMLDGVLQAAREKIFAQNAFTQADTWFDSDTGQEWCGREVDIVREEVWKEIERTLQASRPT